jgi:hypothetical protein
VGKGDNPTDGRTGGAAGVEAKVLRFALYLTAAWCLFNAVGARTTDVNGAIFQAMHAVCAVVALAGLAASARRD